MKLMIKLSLLLTTAFTVGCSGSIEELAQNNLYPFEQVNKKYAVPEVPPEGLEQLELKVIADDKSEMNIHGWTHKATNPDARVFIYFHGNGENLQALQQFNMLKALKTLNSHFVVIDYPGLGRSTGKPNEFNLVQSALATIDWASQKFPSSPVIVWGRSLGAAVATQAVKQRPGVIDGFILTSPWNNFLDAARALSKLADSIPKEWLAKNTYDSAAAAQSIRVTTLIHHGVLDKLIPIDLGRKTAASFPDQSQVLFKEVEGKEHNDIFTTPTLWQDVKGFIR
jgi:pimeloyl-ACP methyl ester carboxylesterase